MVRPWGYNKKLSVPSKEKLAASFHKLGTQIAVARSLDVSRATVLKWQKELGLEVKSHPEVSRAATIRGFLKERTDRVRIAQWICDEGWISTSYHSKADSTFLIVGGQMTDVEAIGLIARVLHEKVTKETGEPHYGWLPLGAVKLRSAKAYALLQTIRSELAGLKKMEAEAALKFFPPTGFLKGRHSTAEFMASSWLEHARRAVAEWNRKRRHPVPQSEAEMIVRSWMEKRLKKGTLNRSSDGERKPNLGESLAPW